MSRGKNQEKIQERELLLVVTSKPINKGTASLSPPTIQKKD